MIVDLWRTRIHRLRAEAQLRDIAAMETEREIQAFVVEDDEDARHLRELRLFLWRQLREAAALERKADEARECEMRARLLAHQPMSQESLIAHRAGMAAIFGKGTVSA